jgi:hypothetical protein
MIPIVLIPQIADLLGLRDCLRLKWATKEIYEVLHQDYHLEDTTSLRPMITSSEIIRKIWTWIVNGQTYEIVTEEGILGSVRSLVFQVWLKCPSEKYDYYTILCYQRAGLSAAFLKYLDDRVRNDPVIKGVVDKILN